MDYKRNRMSLLDNLRLQVQLIASSAVLRLTRNRLSTKLELADAVDLCEEFDSKPSTKRICLWRKPEEQPRRIRKARGRRNLENFSNLPVQEHVTS